MDKKILEILVDKNNLKWPWVFEHILIVLHKVFDDFEKSKLFKKVKNNQPTFSFEITKIGNRIRFFIISPTKYTNYLTNQIYAHYNDVEIIPVWDYLEKIPNDKIKVWKVSLKKHNYYPIKSFTELQEEASKDIVDPFSSITSALSMTWKYTLNTFQINFTPIDDDDWKDDNIEKRTIKILLSKYPKKIEELLLSHYLYLWKILLFPFILISKILSIFIPKNSDSEEDTNVEENEMPDYFKKKLELFAYKTSINIIHAWEDEVEAKWAIREIFSTYQYFQIFD